MNAHYKEILIEIQDRLFTVGAILATPPEKKSRKRRTAFKKTIIESDIELLENEIDSMENACHP
jgi:cob(I)alamin adenosyltransferase